MRPARGYPSRFPGKIGLPLDIFPVWMYLYRVSIEIAPKVSVSPKSCPPLVCAMQQGLRRKLFPSEKEFFVDKLELVKQFLASGHLPFAALSAGGLVIIVFLVMLLAKPLGKIVKLLLHAVLGFALLFVLNTYVPLEFLHLEPNLANCIVAGVGGVPGVILLLLFQYFIAK